MAKRKRLVRRGWAVVSGRADKKDIRIVRFSRAAAEIDASNCSVGWWNAEVVPVEIREIAPKRRAVKRGK